jgi:DNA-binding transcriptional MerR regulator
MEIGTASANPGCRQRQSAITRKSGSSGPVGRNGYRDYLISDVHRLRFLQRSRSLGFSVDECRQLLSLYGDKERESADVKAIAEVKLAEVDRKIAKLASFRDMLRHLVHNCNGDERPACPIIDGLAGGTVQ